MMRLAPAGAALVATTAALAAVLVAGSPEATLQSGEQLVDQVARVAPSSVDSFRSVRSYEDVAEPVRLRIPAAAVDTRLQQQQPGQHPHRRLGIAAAGPDRIVWVPRTLTWPPINAFEPV